MVLHHFTISPPPLDLARNRHCHRCFVTRGAWHRRHPWESTRTTAAFGISIPNTHAAMQ